MNLSPDQLHAVRSRAPITIAEACPGSGKTTTLIARLQALLNEGVDAQQIIVTTYTNSAVENIRAKLPGVSFYHLGTIHALCWRMIQHRHQLRGFVNPTIIPEEQVEGLLKLTASRMGHKGALSKVQELLATGWRPNTGGRLNPIELVVAQYHMDCARAGYYDYDAILHGGLKAITEGCIPDKPAVNFIELLVDEAQDGGILDQRIFRAIPADRRFIVGDPMQSIFGFRGAYPEAMQDWAKEPGAYPTPLRGCYRSMGPIVAVANRLSEVAHLPQMTSAVDPDSKFGCVRVSAQENIAAMAADLAQTLIRSGYQPEQQAILCRTNQQVRDYTAGCMAAGLPVRQQTRQLPSQDLEQLKLWLAIAANPGANYLTVIYMERYVAEFYTAATRQAMSAAMLDANSAALAAKLVPENAQITALGDPAYTHTAIPAPKALFAMLSGPHGAVLRDLNPGVALAELRSIPQTVEVAGTKGIHILTVHAAKGMEWDHVIIPEFHHGVWPFANTRNLAEDRRLAYVAVTRARHRVDLLWARHWASQWGGPQVGRVSPFAVEMGLALGEDVK